MIFPTLSTSKEIREFFGTEPLQSASLRVTMSCNLKCQQCYALAGKRLKDELTLEEIKKLLDDLKELGVIRIFFTGGEPFARPDIIKILEYADKNDFAMYISTNGTLVTPNMIGKLKLLKHLRTFQISIDGFDTLHDSIRGVKGTFNSAIKTIELATKELKNTKITIISTLMSSNVGEMENLLEMAIKLKVDTFGVVDLYPVKRSTEAQEISASQKHELFQKLGKLYEKKHPKKLKIGLLIPPALMPSSLKEVEYGCGYVCSFPSLLGIHANGDVAPCDGLLNYKEFILGNIRKKTLREIWNHPIMQDLRAIKPTDIKGVCRKCKYLSFCMGGCRARVYIKHGNFKSSYPLCESFYKAGYFPKNSLK